MSRTTVRRGMIAATAATAAWILLGAESVLRPGSMSYRDAVWLIPWSLTAVVLAYLHMIQRDRAGRLERGSFWAVITAMGLAAAGTLGVLLDIDALKVLGFPLGAVLWVAAMLPFGVATVRAGVVPAYAGVALALLEPASLLTGIVLSPIAGLHDRGSYSAGLEKGLVTLLVARALWRLARNAGRDTEAPNARPVPKSGRISS